MDKSKSIYKVTKSHIIGNNGKKLYFDHAFISPFGKPRNGWKANIEVRGILNQVSAKNSVGVFLKVVELFSKNDIEVDRASIWATLNIQWYDTTPDKYKVVSLSEIMSAVDIEGANRVYLPDGRLRVYTPADWGSTAWDFMGLYLSKDDYSWGVFYSILEIIRGMLNENVNPSIGCIKCYSEFTRELDMLRSNPKYEIAEARKWLVDFHNSVNERLGKRKFTYEQAEKQHLWK